MATTTPIYTMLDVDKVKNYILSRLNTAISDDLLKAIFKVLPFLSNYKEEGNEFSFSIALGFDIDISSINARVTEITQFSLNDESKTDDEFTMDKYIYSKLKDVIIFCRRGCSMYIIQDKKQNVSIGIYYTDIEKTGTTRESILNNNIILFEPFKKTKVILSYKDESHYIYFDLDDVQTTQELVPASDESDDAKYLVRRIWDGIFERVKREVHGTICLVVNSDWDKDSDDTFIEINSVNDLAIPIKRPESISDANELATNITTLISMLDYDGVTIIDTRSRILAYHNFCQEISKKPQHTGGARRNAFEYIMSKKESNYAGVYFQSQEGQIDFYNFNTDNIVHYFDSSIMETPNDSSATPPGDTPLPSGSPSPHNGPAPAAVISQANTEDDVSQVIYNDLLRLSQDLLSAHNGMNNFYLEEGPAYSLLEYLKLNSDGCVRVLAKNTGLANYLVRAVFECLIGNTYGVSMVALPYCNEIIDFLDANFISEFINNYLLSDFNLTWLLSQSGPYTRYQRFISNMIDTKKVIIRQEILSMKSSDFFNYYYSLATNNTI